MGFHGCRKDSTQWCGACYSNYKGRTNYAGHAGYRVVRGLTVVRVAFMLQRPKADKTQSGAAIPAKDEVMGTTYPHLWEYLAEEGYTDGTPRETSTLMTLVEEGRVKLGLNDREEGRSVWVSGRTWVEALQALERALASDQADWRATRQGKGRGKGR